MLYFFSIFKYSLHIIIFSDIKPHVNLKGLGVRFKMIQKIKENTYSLP